METLALKVGVLERGGEYRQALPVRCQMLGVTRWASHSGHIEVSIRRGDDNAKTQKIAMMPFLAEWRLVLTSYPKKVNVAALI